MLHWRNETGTESLGPFCPPQIPLSTVLGCSGDAVQFYSRGYRLQPSPPDELWDTPSKHTVTDSIATIAFARFIGIFTAH